MNKMTERVSKEEEQKLVKKIKNYIYDPAELIGSGFSSNVFKGMNELNREVIAIKVLELGKIQSEVEKYLLNNQINALRALSHPHILRTIEILMTKNNVYIMTQFCQNGDLQQYVKSKTKLPQLQALLIIRDIVQGYRAIEEKQIVHRDLKTANIFLTASGARIADFGFCQFLNEVKKPQLFYNVGSPAYMSPESYRENVYSSKSDVWSIGIIFFQMLVGETPDKNLTYSEMSGNLMAGKVSSGNNEEIRKILSACFKKDLKDRVSPFHLLDMITKQIARLEGNKNNGRVQTGQSHNGHSLPSSNSKPPGINIQLMSGGVHPLSPSDVNVRQSTQNRHMIASMLPAKSQESGGQSPIKNRFVGMGFREDQKGFQTSPLKPGFEKQLLKLDEPRLQMKQNPSLTRIKNLTQMLLFLYRLLNCLSQTNLECSKYMRMVLFRHRSYLQGTVQRIASEQRLDRINNQAVKDFHFLKSKFDDAYIQRQTETGNYNTPTNILQKINQMSNHSFNQLTSLAAYCWISLQAHRQCQKTIYSANMDPQTQSRIGVAWDYMMIHFQILQLYVQGQSMQSIKQEYIPLGTILKQQPKKLGPAHFQLLRIKSKMMSEQYEQWSLDIDRQKRASDQGLNGYRMLGEVPQRKTLIYNGFF